MAVQSGQVRRGAVALLGTAAVGAGLLVSSASAAGLASETPQQVLKAASAAVRGAKGYEMHFDIQHPSMVGTLIGPGHGALSMTFEQNNTGTASVILVGGKGYLKASVEFWAKHGTSKQLAKLLAPRWYKVPKSEFSGLTKSFQQISPSQFARCTAQDHGPLSNLGSSTVDGQEAVVLKDAGGKPGTTPGTIAIAATGKAYPLRIVSTGPTLAGGPVNSCGDGKASKTTGSVTITHWNTPPAVKAPANAIPLPSSASGA